jgi:hypothetical protein
MARHVEGCNNNNFIHETKQLPNYSLISAIKIM